MPIYATVIDLREEMNLDSAAHDATLVRILDAAEVKINNFCKRPDGFVADTSATARYYVGSGDPYQDIDECVEITGVAVKDSVSDDEDSYTAWTLGVVGTTTGADCFPARGSKKRPDYRTPAQVGKPYTMLVIGANADYSTFTGGGWTGRSGFRRTLTMRGLPTVQVTARWGYASTVPADIKEATIMQAARWYKRLQSAMADATASAELGQLLYTQKLDPDIAGILIDGGYVRKARSIGGI
jgi:hypothetical protein